MMKRRPRPRKGIHAKAYAANAAMVIGITVVGNDQLTALSLLGLPLAIFLLYNFISQLPRDLFESASIDGASAFQTFIRIVLPLSVPALGAFAIFQFLWVWNDLLVALVFLGPGSDVQVMPTALFNLIGGRGGQWHLLTAGAFLTMVVPLLVFLALQRAFVRGILAGSVKS